MLSMIDTLERIPTAALRPAPDNPVIHDDEHVAAIARSIQEYGFVAPIIVSRDNEVIAGHGRLMAAKHLDIQTVPVVRAEHLTPAQVRAYRIADNQLARLAPWDWSQLAATVADLKQANVPLDTLGFDTYDLDALTRQPETPAPLPPTRPDQQTAAEDQPTPVETPEAKRIKNYMQKTRSVSTRHVAVRWGQLEFIVTRALTEAFAQAAAQHIDVSHFFSRVITAGLAATSDDT